MSSYEERVSNQFGSFCIKVLKNKSRDIDNENALVNQTVKSFLDLTKDEYLSIAVNEQYFEKDYVFNVLEKQVVIHNRELSEALCKIPDKHRDIILLSYFLDMSDEDISKTFHTLRQTITYRKKAAVKKLREKICEEEIEWNNL